MARKRQVKRPRRGGTLSELRKQAQAVMKRLHRAGRQQVSTIERQIRRLSAQRDQLLRELRQAVAGTSRAASARRPRRAPARRARGRRTRVDWNKVYTKLPRGSFSASDVRKIVPRVAPGTLSQRLTGWVKQKKLRRTGSRRGTRYTRA